MTQQHARQNTGLSGWLCEITRNFKIAREKFSVHVGDERSAITREVYDDDAFCSKLRVCSHDYEPREACQAQSRDQLLG